MAFARCIGSWIDNDSLDDATILGAPLRRLRPKSKKVLHAHLFNSVDCFVFDFGCVVLWGCSRPQLARAVEALLPWTEAPRARPTEDRVLYRPASARAEDEDRHLSCITGDTIYLSTESVLERLGYPRHRFDPAHRVHHHPLHRYVDISCSLFSLTGPSDWLGSCSSSLQGSSSTRWSTTPSPSTCRWSRKTGVPSR